MFDTTHLLSFIFRIALCLGMVSACIYAVNPDEDDMED